jgi:hypothetical protein
MPELNNLKRVKAETEEIYNLFLKLGITQKEFDSWMDIITTDKRRSGTRVTDLALLVLIKYGFKQKHLQRMGIRLQYRRVRCKRFTLRFKYLVEVFNECSNTINQIT